MLNWRNVRIIGFDTETTGLEPDEDCIVEMSFLVDDPKRGQREWNTLCGIEEGMTLTPETSKIHGIWADQLEGLPTAVEQAQDLYDWLAPEITPNTIWLAMNAPFDLAFLLRTFRKAKVPFPIDAKRVIDPVAFARSEWKTNKLWELAKRVGVTNDQAHSALGDVKTTVQVMYKLVELLELPDNLDDVLVWQEKCVKDWEKITGHKYREQLIAVGGWSVPDGRW